MWRKGGVKLDFKSDNVRQSDIKGTPQQPQNVPQTYWEHFSPWFSSSSIVGMLHEHCRKVFERQFEGAAWPSHNFFLSASHCSHCLPLSRSCQSHFDRASGVSLNPPHPFSIWIALHRNTHAQTDTYLIRPPLWYSIWFSRFRPIGVHSLALSQHIEHICMYSQLIIHTDTHTPEKHVQVSVTSR